MRCPRCNAHVMPGVEDCIACGQSLTEAPAPPKTLPSLKSGTGTDLLDQRKKVKSATSKSRPGKGPDPDSESIHGHSSYAMTIRDMLQDMFGQWPPVWAAIGGMFFGIWFFFNGQKRLGYIFAALETLLFATLFLTSWFGVRVPFLPFIVYSVILSAGFNATHQRLIQKKYTSQPQQFILGLLGTIAAFFLIVLLFRVVPLTAIRMFRPDIQFLMLGPGITMYEPHIPAGSRIIILPIDLEGRGVRQGDIVFRRQNPHRVIALAGDNVWVGECEISVNDEVVPIEHWPLDNQWEADRCDVEIEDYNVKEDNFMTLIRVRRYRRGMAWEPIIYSLKSVTGRLVLIYWPISEWRNFP